MGSKGGIKKPHKVAKPNGKQARQMLIAMALAWHVGSKWVTRVRFMIQGRLEAQVLFVLMAPFLAIPAAMVAIPATCMFLSALAVAGVSSNVTRMNGIQQLMDRHQFQKLGRQANLFNHSFMGKQPEKTGFFGKTAGMGGLRSSVTRRSSAAPTTFSFGAIAA